MNGILNTRDICKVEKFKSLLWRLLGFNETMVPTNLNTLLTNAFTKRNVEISYSVKNGLFLHLYYNHDI